MTGLLADAPCGCDRLQEAAESADPRVSAAKESDGKHWRRQWQCPRARTRSDGTDPDPTDSPVTDPACLAALRAVERATGAEGLCTCPLYYARLDWVGEVVRLRRWFKTGQLALRIPHPPGVLVDAIDAIEDSLALRESWELEQVRQRNPAPPAAAPVARPPPRPVTPPKP